jgi:hypothetical protein
MKRNILILSCLGIFLFFPRPASAECVDAAGFTSFFLTGQATIVLYAGSIPLAQFDVPDCVVLPSSQMQLLKGSICDGDEILIDNERCVIIAVKALY